MATDIERQLPAGPRAVAQARSVVDELAGGLARRDLESLRLLVSELVTNAIRHGAAPNGHRLDLRLRVGPDAARVEVLDWGSGFAPGPRRPGRAANSGWGLVLVDVISDRWGVEREPRTKVWAELRLRRRGSRAADAKRPERGHAAGRARLLAAPTSV